MQQPVNPESSRKGIAQLHPKLVALTADISQRLQNYCSFRHNVNDLSTFGPTELEYHQTINHFPSPPWQLSTPPK